VRYRQALLLSALAVAPAIHAETLYVIEQVVVNVNSAPDATGERVTTIKSGEALEVLDRQGEQIHVRLANGTEGWVRKSYLSAEEPLQHRLTERISEVEKLKQEVARLEGALAAATNKAVTKTPTAAAGTAAAGVARAAGTAAPGTPTSAGAARAMSAATPTSVGPARAAAAGTATAAEGASGATTASTAAESPDPAETNGAANDPAPGEPAYFMTPPESPARPVWHWALGSFVVALGSGFALGWYVLDRRIRRKYGGLRIY
jgi:hypothetical protein